MCSVGVSVRTTALVRIARTVGCSVQSKKQVSSRELRRVLEQTQTAIGVLAQSVAADFDRAGAFMNATREFMADLSARVERVEALLRTKDV